MAVGEEEEAVKGGYEEGERDVEEEDGREAGVVAEMSGCVEGARLPRVSGRVRRAVGRDGVGVVRRRGASEEEVIVEGSVVLPGRVCCRCCRLGNGRREDEKLGVVVGRSVTPQNTPDLPQ